MFVVFGHSSGDDTLIGVSIFRSLVLIGPNLSATYIAAIKVEGKLRYTYLFPTNEFNIRTLLKPTPRSLNIR